MKLELKIQSALGLLERKFPFYAYALGCLTFVEENTCETMSVDKWWRLYYNREFAERLSVPWMALIIHHELEHLLREHHKRTPEDVVFDFWNIAADMEINDDLKDYWKELQAAKPEEPICLPKNFGFPDGLLAEEYYGMFRPVTDAIKKLAKAVLQGQGGSGVSGKSESWELGPPTAENPNGVAEKDVQSILDRVGEDAANHMGQGRGDVPLGAQRHVNRTKKPTLDWRALLRRYLAPFIPSRGYDLRSYRRPGRWDGLSDFIFPSWRGYSPGGVAIVIDTSGSMDQELLEKAVAEVKGIFGVISTNITVISVDCATHRTQSVNDVSKIELAGGGGTDMGVGIEAAEKMRPLPTVCVVMTDGETPWPQKKRKVPVIACIVSSQLHGRGFGNRAWPIPDWIKAVHVKK